MRRGAPALEKAHTLCAPTHIVPDTCVGKTPHTHQFSTVGWELYLHHPIFYMGRGVLPILPNLMRPAGVLWFSCTDIPHPSCDWCGLWGCGLIASDTNCSTSALLSIKQGHDYLSEQLMELRRVSDYIVGLTMKDIVRTDGRAAEDCWARFQGP